ncbi:hypothetical protein FACS1894105_09740 [Clostridia bacterium]|nr:hypothetical protein FACS1894105_09740 [Clostridia bacterium]
MLSDKQKSNYAFFQAHLNEYLANPLLAGKVCVFYNEQLVKAFDNFENAAKFAFAECDDDFVIQEIVDEIKFVNYNKWVGAFNA